MRLSTAPSREEASARAVLHAALDAGVRLLDTAHAYALQDSELGHNERWVRAALGSHPAGSEVRVVTKGGMVRPQGRWIPDGRARVLEAHAVASAEALGRPPDLYLVHAPDPRVAWTTTVRQLARLQASGVVRAVGVSNVTLDQLDAALGLAPVTAVELALSPLDDAALRAGVVARCVDRGLAVLAHAPLGGPRRAPALLRHPALTAEAQRLGVSPAAVALAAVLELHPLVQVLPGARRPETARDAASAQALRLPPDALQRLRAAFPALTPLAGRAAAAPSRPSAALPPASGEVVLLMGIQGAGKSELVQDWVQQGYRRLNRDEAGGTLRALAQQAAELLGRGERRLVLDNTYVTRASRAEVLDVAALAGVPVRGVWVDIPLHEAQVNVIERMLAAHGRLLEPEELRAGRDNTALSPLAPLRLWRTLEEPNEDEGFASLERRPFVRRTGRGEALCYADAQLGLAHAVPFAWLPDADDAAVTALRARGALVCPHGPGPPQCWCRPPLPGLLLAHARAHGVDLRRSEVHGTSEAHQVMAQVLGARWVSHSGRVLG
jgi:aryl-alcohol dehydrogenase-like predicted oxidoreductase